MKVFVAGATGALGVPVVRRLIAEGHEVVGLTRTPSKKCLLESLGAVAIVGDALDRATVLSALLSAKPEAVVHALTAIPKYGPLRASDLEPTNELRIRATRNLLDAALAAGVRRFVAESMVFIYGYGDLGAAPISEERPTASAVPRPWLLPAIRALEHEESQVLEASRAHRIDGIVLRFGGFYGPGAGIDLMARLLKRRLMPLPGRSRGGAVAWIQIEDAAAAVIAALHHGRSGAIYNVVDDNPVSFAGLISELARAIGAPQPLRAPLWLIRLIAPYVEASLLGSRMLISNRKAKQELQWAPRYPSYRDGIADFAVRSRACAS